MPNVTNVNFRDENFFENLIDKINPSYEHIMYFFFYYYYYYVLFLKKIEREALYLLGLCHSIVTEEKSDEIIFNASSPDELALLNFAKLSKFEFLETNENNIMKLKINGINNSFELLNMLEFSSNR